MLVWIDSEIAPPRIDDDCGEWFWVKTPKKFLTILVNSEHIKEISIGNKLGQLTVDDIVEILIVRKISPEVIQFHSTNNCHSYAQKLSKAGCNSKIKTVSYGKEFIKGK